MGQALEELMEIIDEINYSCVEIDGTELRDFRLAEYLLKPSNTVVQI